MSEGNGSSNGRARLDDGKVRVALIGVGNCANSLLQGREYYKDAPDDQFVPGLMHVNLGGYHVRDIEFTAAFDVVKGKVGEDLSDVGPGVEREELRRGVVQDPVVHEEPPGSGVVSTESDGRPQRWGRSLRDRTLRTPPRLTATRQMAA